MPKSPYQKSEDEKARLKNMMTRMQKTQAEFAMLDHHLYDSKPSHTLPFDRVAKLKAMAMSPIITDPSNFVVIDYETFYSDACTASNGVYKYTTDPDFDIHCVGVSRQAGGQVVSHVWSPYDPKCEPIDWDEITGPGSVWVSHNFCFDILVHFRAMELGHIPTTALPESWVCSMDASSYVLKTRSLSDSVKVAGLGDGVDKTTRNALKGKRWVDLAAKGETEGLLRYCAQDCELTLKLVNAIWRLFPEGERMLAAEAAVAGVRGFRIETVGLEEKIRALRNVIMEMSQELPWVARGESAASYQAFCAECKSYGVRPPENLSAKDEDTQRWIDANFEIPWVGVMRKIGTCRLALSILTGLVDRSRDEKDYEVCEYVIKYMAAHKTGRDSGGGGLNLQSLAKDAIYITKSPNILLPRSSAEALPADLIHKIAVREEIRARPGYKFCIIDLSQIEPRGVYWHLGRDDLLSHAGERGVYESYAIASGIWDKNKGALKKADATLYALIKILILSLNYGTGHFALRRAILRADLGSEFEDHILRAPIDRELETAWVGWCTVVLGMGNGDLQAEVRKVMENPRLRMECINAYKWHREYHNRIPELKKWHNMLGDRIKACQGGNLSIQLPSGRRLRYYGIARIDGEMTARVGVERRKIYGGLLAENWAQAFARDVFVSIRTRIMRKFENDDVHYMFNVHDEGVWEVPLGIPLSELTSEFVRPEWANDRLPIGCEGVESDFYKK